MRGGRKLVVRWPGGQSEEHELSKPVVSVGRSGSNDIVLNYPTVSKRHLRLELSPDEVRVTDLRSTNGTMLKGRLIPPKTPRVWHPGDVVRVGDVRGNSISLVLKAGSEPSVSTRLLNIQNLMGHRTITIGRDTSSTVHLDHPTVSRRHAEITPRNGGHVIRDLGSMNGTFVNGQRVTGSVPLTMGDVIRAGPYKLVYDRRKKKLTTSVSHGHRLDAMEMGVEVSGGRMILRDVSLSVEAGEFIAVVGGSGSGKSTLLKAMNGFNPATHGWMFIDGQPLYANLDAYRTLMGYVPQEDIIHDVLSVRLALWYAARLRLPDATAEEIERRVIRVLDVVEMTDHADKQVKVLSGGQRKRVSIAVELLAEPDLLFLDEPTSGLDPGLEKKMMFDLNRVADQGRTVVLITHATANIEQCNHVAFLAEGRLAYYGPPQEAISFFQARDFADIYLKLGETVDPARGKAPPSELASYYQAVKARMDAGRANSGEGAGQGALAAGLLWAEHYKRSRQYQRYVAGRQASLRRRSRQEPTPAPAQARVKPKRDSLLRQLLLLARRQFDLIRHDVRTLFVLLVMMPIIASLFMAVSGNTDLTGWQMPEARIDAVLEARLEGEAVGTSESYVPAKSATGLITMLALALTQAGTFGAAFEIVKERSIFKREQAVNLRATAYVLSKALVLGAFALIQVATSLLILGFKVDLCVEPVLALFPSGGWELLVTLLLAVTASIMLGLFISAVIPGPDVLMYVILIQLFVQIILSGGMFRIDSPACKLVISHWTMDAVGSTVDVPGLDQTSRVCTVQEIPQADGTAEREVVCKSAPLGEEELKLDYDHSRGHLLTTWAVLAAQAILWCGLTIWVQARKKA
jgi:ABC-type multidrug transport system ATPase subunit/pSer/pThr/pTyr-binding forkhead associated (FHA) protein